MSTFEVKVYKLKIEPHNNADSLELAVVGDYRSCVRKGQFMTGDFGVYIPEGAIVPDWLIEKIGLTGKLAGPTHNRVKAMKLRGVVSQGLIYPVRSLSSRPVLVVEGKPYISLADGMMTEMIPIIDVVEGQDVAELLGITKYEPPIPVHMAGEVFNAHGYTISYDIENIKKFPDIIEDLDLVVMTEKLHGTWTCLGYHPDVGNVVTSKGLSGQGLAFKFNEANKDNLYIRSLNGTQIETENVIDRAKSVSELKDTAFYILGETYGKGVQDLTYGADKPQFRVFDIYVGNPGAGRYLHFPELVSVCKALNVEMVPIVYHGPFNKRKLIEVTNGLETLSGKATNIREGVVVKTVVERRDVLIGRVQLKSVSDAYLLRKNVDATELQ